MPLNLLQSEIHRGILLRLTVRCTLFLTDVVRRDLNSSKVYRFYVRNFNKIYH